MGVFINRRGHWWGRVHHKHARYVPKAHKMGIYMLHMHYMPLSQNMRQMCRMCAPAQNGQKKKPLGDIAQHPKGESVTCLLSVWHQDATELCPCGSICHAGQVCSGPKELLRGKYALKAQEKHEQNVPIALFFSYLPG